MNAPTRVLCLLAVLCMAVPALAQFPAPCDTRRDCIFNAVRFSQTTLPSAHFIDVENSPTTPRQTALTVELWASIDRQPGKRQFIGGLWGPGTDNNDQWVFYIDEQDRIVFEINAEATRLGQADNTVARAPFSAHYGQWVHLAAVFDGGATSARILINGAVVASATNPAYPVTALKPIERNDLTTRFGACNALADDQNLYRTLSGWIDEVRMWSRAVPDAELLCNKDRSLNGNEAGLVLYYRCNEPVNNNVQICDATGRRNTGLMRSGASNQRSTRQSTRTILASPTEITAELKCDTTISWTVQFTDTAFCGSTATVRMRGPNASRYTLSQTNLTLSQNTPIPITVTYNGSAVGTLVDTLEFRPSNRCGLPNTLVIIRLTRTTELSYSRGSIVFDTLFVGCVQKQFIDSTITICNTSDQLGTPRTVTISQFRTREPLSYRVISPAAPVQIPPGECITVTVRSFVRDTTADYLDSLIIVSDDRCQRVPSVIPLTGRTQEVISIRTPGGDRRIDTLSFNATCPGQLSSPREYTWQNLTLSPLEVDTIIVPPDFTHYRITFPRPLLPRTGYQPIAVRFRPRQPGNVFDSIIIKTRIQGCDIERKIYVRGRGYDNKVEWDVQGGAVDFGNVIVGQQRTINVTARNISTIDTLTVSLYVERGEAFTLLAGTSRRLFPGQSVTVPVTFRPTDSLEYIDRLCLFETRCYTVDCINLRGKGILQTFRFNPLVMETENVVGCQDALDTVHIVNLEATSALLENVTFTNASGRYAVIDPPLPWSTFTIPGRDSLRFIVRYTPNDITADRADRSFIRYQSGGADWEVQLIGTSATPKLFVTQLTAYGTLEVGDRKTERVVVENTSAMPVRVDSIRVPAGFTLLSTSRPLPAMLNPRDSIICQVEFAPTAPQQYGGTVVAYSSEPCVINGSGQVSGRGIIVELEQALSLINFGYVRPCECTERVLPLLNASLVFDMTVDSIFIDGFGIPRPTPQFYSWRSKYSPNGTVPYTIPANSRDTVVITYCPRSPAEDTLIDCQAQINVHARGSGWARQTQTFLAGKRSLTFTPAPVLRQFAPGRVNVLSPAPLRVVVKIPGVTVNPGQDDVVIDSVTFSPDERVFFITSPAAAAFPIRISPGDSLVLDLRQRPRSPRDYEARLTLHFSSPCRGFDTTVLVRGSGFADPRAIEFLYDVQRVETDTFAMISCDTLVVPVYSTIKIDASVVDITMRALYDTTQLRLVDIQSDALSRTCRSQTGNLNFNPSVSVQPSAAGGSFVTCKNFCGVDSLSRVLVMRFVTVSNNRVNTTLTIDSIFFDTEDVLDYKLIANGDVATILALKSEIEMRSDVPFDSVRVLDCADRTITVYNIGDVPNTIDNLVDIPADVQVLTVVPPVGQPIPPGDSAVLTVRYCPPRESSFDSTFVVQSVSPCDTRDTIRTTGLGYAPDFPITMMVTPQFYVADTIRATIGDTITIPVMIEKDFSATYLGRTYWLNGLSFSVDVTHNPRALKFINAFDFAEPLTVSAVPGSVRLNVSQADTIRQGILAQLRFLVTVPDVEQSALRTSLAGFTTDSLQFLDVIAGDTVTPFETIGTCNITVVRFEGGGPSETLVVRPNPVAEEATILFRMVETVPVVCDVINTTGQVVHTLLDGSVVLPGGDYAIRFAAAELPPGLYTVRLSAGLFHATVPMVRVR